MKKFLHSFCIITTITLAFSLSGCCKTESRADSIVAEIRNPQSTNVLVISHRGDWRNYPENSIPAIESVIRMGVDMVEIDVQLTKDSVLILMHDGNIDRCTTGKGRISELTYEQIQQYTLRPIDSLQNTSELKVPTLREALEVCKDRITVNIDKGYDYYDLVLALTEELGVTEQVLIKGGRPLADIEAKMSHYENNLLYMPVVWPASQYGANVFEGYISAEEPQLAYELCWSEMTPEIEACMQRVIADGSKLWVNTLWESLCGGLCDDVAYTTSADEVYGKIVDMGATMIQTDRPEFLLNYLRERGLHN